MKGNPSRGQGVSLSSGRRSQGAPVKRPRTPEELEVEEELVPVEVAHAAATEQHEVFEEEEEEEEMDNPEEEEEEFDEEEEGSEEGVEKEEEEDPEVEGDEEEEEDPKEEEDEGRTQNTQNTVDVLAKVKQSMEYFACMWTITPPLRTPESANVTSPQTCVASTTAADAGSGAKSKKQKQVATKKSKAGKGKTKVQEQLQVPKELATDTEAKRLAAMWEELKELNEKKLDNNSFTLPMSCLKRPPKDESGKGPLEIREPDERHVRTIIESMKKNPFPDTLPHVGLIDPKEVSRKEDVDWEKVEEGGYNIFVIGGGHTREARERLRRLHPDTEQFHYANCFVYVGLTNEEARQIAHEHNHQRTNPQFQVFMRSNEVWALQNKIFDMWLKGDTLNQKLKAPAMKKSKGTQVENEEGASAVKPVAEKKKKEKRFDVAEALRQANAFFHPHAPVEDEKIVAEPLDMPQAPWVEMGSLDDDSVTPILEQVIAKELSIEGMRKKFEVAKRLGYVAKYFLTETGSSTWEECKELYPVHTTKELLEPFASNWRAKGDVPKALVAHVDRAKAWKELDDKRKAEMRRSRQRIALAEEATVHFSDWTEIKHEDRSGLVKVLEGDMLDLKNLQNPLPFSLVICDFPYGFNLSMLADDTQPFPEDDIVHVLQNVKEVCTGPLWTVAGFCSVNMLSYVRNAFVRVCNAGQEVVTWCKPNVMNTGDPRLVSAIEFCVIGYYSVTGSREAAHYNFASTDPCHNYRLFDAVMKKNCLVVEKNSRCVIGIRTRILNDIGPTIDRECRRKEAEEADKYYNCAFVAEEEATGTDARPTNEEPEVISAAKKTAASQAAGTAATGTAAAATDAGVVAEGAAAAATAATVTVTAAAATTGPATAPATVPASAAQRRQGSCIEPGASQDLSVGTTTRGARKRKQAAAAEEVTSPRAKTHVIALSSRATSDALTRDAGGSAN
ncbi:hypothetical protein CBR_g44476 [Chara braunii]|uniref:Uncharacterized protein n=1 Tax=Chara braunii TaxID=69332 RepID=A0A388LXR5_CHABU|nr:hypothetical protein CBR_g44476 [Chara braunii]|eukprot:GBG87022.1 hypothetical protein CBR_g44476 [Chara braunii]